MRNEGRIAKALRETPAPRVRLIRCADGERVDITDALEAERARLRAAREDAKRGEALLFAAGGFAAMVFVLLWAWVASWVGSW